MPSVKKILRVRWIFVAVLIMALMNGGRGQPGEGQPEPGNTSPAPITSDQSDQSDGTNEDTTVPASTPAPTTTPVPVTTPASEDDGDDSDEDEDSAECVDGTEGTSEGVVVCCTSSCDTCSDDDGCGEDDVSDGECCPSAIASSADSCDDVEPPCIVTNGTSIWIIVLAVIVATLLLGNAVWCCMFRGRGKRPETSSLPVSVRNPNADADAVRLQNAEAQIRRLQEDLTNERTRRMKADGIIQRNKGGGARPDDFPSVRDVDLHVENLAGHGINWAQKACVSRGTHSALPATIKSVLENAFLVCREEVKRCFDERLQSLSGFLGNDEPVVLSGGDSMNLDTQYVLYECLRRNFQTIVSTEPDHVKELAGVVQQRCEEVADGSLAEDVIFGDDAWPLFDNLMKKYVMVFVEMALQNPAMDFNDDLGASRAFDPVVHRDWAPHLDAPTDQCCVVFPAILQQDDRPKSNAMVGVVRLSA